jgi:hypothetical protein
MFDLLSKEATTYGFYFCQAYTVKISSEVEYDPSGEEEEALFDL